MRMFLLAALPVLGLAGAASGAVTAYEPFGTPGALAGSNGGTGFSTAWGDPVISDVTGGTGSANVTSGSMGYNTLVTQGGKLELDVTKAAKVSVTRTLSTPIVSNPDDAVTKPVVYVSMLLKPSQTVEAWRTGLGFRFDGTNYLSFNANFDDNWRTETNMAYGANSGVAATATDTFVVLRFTPGAWNLTAIDYWVNPSQASLGALAAPAPLSSGGTNQGFSYTTLTAFAQITTDGNAPSAFKATLDEFRMGSTWADVTPVPEPTGIAAVAGLFGMLLLRRRK